MAIERRLIELVGPVGGKVHTGRSRNDQVALDLQLYLRSAVPAHQACIVGLMSALLSQAEKHADVVFPGYTHLQRAQPVILAPSLPGLLLRVSAGLGALRRVEGHLVDAARRRGAGGRELPARPRDGRSRAGVRPGGSQRHGRRGALATPRSPICRSRRTAR